MKTTRSLNLLLLTGLLLVFVAAFACKNKAQKITAVKTGLKTDKEIYSTPKTDSAFIDAFLKREPYYKEEDTLLRRFYQERDYHLAWFTGDKLIPQATKFIEVLSNVQQDGLDPKTYQHNNFNQLYKSFSELPNKDPQKAERQIELDLALTGTYFKYATDFYKGIVNPREAGEIEWKVKRNKFKPIKALQAILRERESRYPYYQFAPLHTEYNELRKALSHLREIKRNGGWPQVPAIKSLKKGDSSDVVPVLRKRLQEYLPASARNNNKVYDDNLMQAVKKFQELHGLKPDGVLGKGTLASMNVSLDNRIDQLIINMERWRWVPKRLPEKHIFINIPEYQLYIVENGKRVKDMKVIVGKTMNSTPVFSDKLEYIVFSPYWNVTENILFDEVIPAQIRNPNFLASQDMEVIKDLGKNKVQVIPTSSIDWVSVDRTNFKYRVRQKPGSKNPLGYVKFIFPNSYDVYLHDTPNDYLFSQADRGFSHGCIRISDPEGMAEYLLKDQPEWTHSRIKQAMKAGTEQYVNLKEDVPVYIVYFTAWVDDKGQSHFRDDIYGHDRQLAQAYF